MIPFFTELFEYSHHFNRQLATVLITHADKAPEKSVKWFSHILNAHQVWNSRILSDKNKFGVWELHSLSELIKIDQDNYDNSIKILDQGDMEAEIKYVTSKGDPYTNTTRDILFHIINHSTYHRGQIAADLRQQGLEPIVSDYIFYKR